MCRWSVDPLRSKIAKVLPKVHHGKCLTPLAMTAMVRLIGGTGLEIALKAKSLLSLNNKVTVSSREIQSAVRLTLCEDLAKHAVSEGTKAVTKFCCY